MKQDEKIQFFLELLNCSYELHCWKFDGEYQFLSMDWKKDLFTGGFFSYIGFEELLRERLKEGKRQPVILETGHNLLWIAGFEFDGERLKHLYYIGPMFSGRDSLMILRKNLDTHNLSVALRAKIFKTFADIPVVSGNMIQQYAVMLEYTLNQNRISRDDVDIINNESVFHAFSREKTEEEEKAAEEIEEAETHMGIWEAEQELCRMLEEGDPRYKEMLQKSSMLSSGMKVELGDTLRTQKNNALVLLTICSRACLRGGLSPEIAYNLNDYYAQRIEESRSLTDSYKLCKELLEEYVSRVRERKENTKISNTVRNACEYIKKHLTEPVTVKILADQSGYTEYYFSYKFKKELGMTISEYILREKTERAKLLLTGSRKSIQEISDELAFGNRSYFYTCFQKQTGMSPSEYRKKKGSQ